MKRPKTKKDTIFFAYQAPQKGENDANVDAIRSAIQSYNSHQKRFTAISWENYKTSSQINKEVLNAISDCSIFACDVTHFNHNVLFELGYAIGKGKEVLILLNSTVASAGARYSESLLKAYRYQTFSNRKDIASALQNKHYSSDISNQFLTQKASNYCNLLYIKNSVSTEASIELTSNIDRLNTSKIIDDIAESKFKTNEWYARSILATKIVLIDFLGSNMLGASDENSWKAFWAGFAIALERKVLITAPSKFRAPLDFHDIVIAYTDPSNLIDSAMPVINNWLSELESSEIIVQQPDIDRKLDLLKLAIGEGIAEQEKDKLKYYFVETPEYRAALDKNHVLIVGDKGTGKTALHLRLVDELSKEKNVFLITLKPEAHELLDDINIAKIFTTKPSKRSFFLSLWKLVIFSKLLLSISERVLASPDCHSPAEKKILMFADEHSTFLESNIYGVMKKLCRKSGDDIRAETLESVYDSYIGPLSDNIRNYFASHSMKYQKIILLADNLDKTWDNNYDLDLQSELVLALLEVNSFIQKLIPTNGGNNISVQEVFFLRKDIYEFIRKRHPDPDKMAINTMEINWAPRKDLLKEMIEKRFQYVLQLGSKEEAKAVWENHFSLDRQLIKHPFDIIFEVINPRPRDLIVFVTRLFETAYNYGRDKVTPEDFDNTLEIYSSIINQNIIAEIKAEFPYVEGLLVELQRYRSLSISHKVLLSILENSAVPESERNQLIETLFLKGYLIAYNHRTDQMISNLDTLSESLKLKRWWPYWPLLPKISIYPFAKSYYLELKKKSANKA